MSGIMLLAAGLLIGANPASDSPVVKAVKKEINTLNEAFKKQDAAAIKRLMADDHICVASYHPFQTKADQLKTLGEYKITEYQPGDMKVVIVAPDTALVSYPLNLKGTYKGTAMPAKNFVIAVWVKTGEQWQEVSYQETPDLTGK